MAKAISNKAVSDLEQKLAGKWHFFAGGMNFPVIVVTNNEWEEEQLSYLKRNFQRGGFTTKSICEWCIRHQMEYWIFYPTRIGYILKHPYTFIKYLQLKKELECSC